MVTKVQRQDSIKCICSKTEQASEITMTPALYYRCTTQTWYIACIVSACGLNDYKY